MSTLAMLKNLACHTSTRALTAGQTLLVVTLGTTAGIYSYNFNALTVGAITAPSSPVLVNTAITASASFTDAYPANSFTASWNWGDGTTSGTVTQVNGYSGSVTDTHTYTSAGV